MDSKILFYLLFAAFIGAILGYLIANNLRKAKLSKYIQDYQLLESKLQTETDQKKSIELSIEQYRNEAQNAKIELTKYSSSNETIAQRILEIQAELVSHQLEIKQLNQERTELKKTIAQKEEQLRSQEEQKQFLEKTRADLKDQFRSLSYEMLKNSRDELLNTSRTNISEPFEKEVKSLREKIEEVNKKNIEKLQELQVITKDLSIKSIDVEQAAQQLTSALRNPNIKGTWGEVNLKRIMEFVGLIQYCDFREQETFTSDDKQYRPDCVITIPGERTLIIDSKTPLDSYMEAVKATDESEKKSAISNHVNKVKLHIDSLSKKDYISKLSPKKHQIIDAVILFIPVEGALSIALESDPTLLEYAFNKKIILTFPTSLLAILKGFSMTIQQQSVSRNIDQILNESKLLYERFELFITKFEKVGDKLRQVTTAYNDSIKSYSKQLRPQALKIAELSSSTNSPKNLEELNEQITSLGINNRTE